MLDDLKLIHERDAEDALGIAGKQSEQLIKDVSVLGRWQDGTILNVVYAGMGGSALAASFVASWPVLDKPFEIVRNYHVPAYTGSQTLVILASYSGNTEETLHAFDEAQS